jgi:Tfp pilus assembly protein PilO
MFRALFPFIFIISAIGLFFGYIDPSYDGVKALKVQENEFNQALNKSKELKEIRDELISKYNAFSTNDLNRLNKLLPDNVDNVRLVLDIDNIASAYNMRIKDVTIIRSEEREPGIIGPSENLYESVKLTFSTVSSYENLKLFLKDLESSLRIVDVIEASFIQPIGDLYEYNIGIRTYWLK